MGRERSGRRRRRPPAGAALRRRLRVAGRLAAVGDAAAGRKRAMGKCTTRHVVSAPRHGRWAAQPAPAGGCRQSYDTLPLREVSPAAGSRPSRAWRTRSRSWETGLGGRAISLCAAPARRRAAAAAAARAAPRGAVKKSSPVSAPI
ncbi:Protein of unknown function [Gryllus bimaculatus]|nr:Protein of unknown function [Gryllus bimaculatus]